MNMELKSMAVLAELNRPPSEDKRAQHLAEAGIAAKRGGLNRLHRVRWTLGAPLVWLGTRMQRPGAGLNPQRAGAAASD
jgi:hypothetical protein